MEKVTTKSEIKKNGKVVGEKPEFLGWKFDADERLALGNILKDKFDKKKIDTYLILLEFICFHMKIWNEDMLSNKEVKSYINTIFNSVNKTNKYLRKLEKKELATGVPFGFPNFLGSDPQPGDKRHGSNSDRYVETISNSAKASRISLEKLKSQIERQLLEWENPPNRAKADSHSFYYDMARRYSQIFKENPNNKKEGFFYQIVVEVLRILNLKSDDPSRKVDQAIEKYEETKGL